MGSVIRGAGNEQPSRSLRLPWPAEWPTRPKLWMVLGFLVLSAFAIGFAGLAMAAYGYGDHGSMVYFGGVAALLALLVSGWAPILRVRRRWSPQAVKSHTGDAGERGVCIPYSAWWYAWLVALMSTTGTLFGAVVLSALFGGNVAGSRTAVGVLLGVVVVPFCGWFLFQVARGRVARGRVVMTPSGVSHRNLLFEEFVPWGSIRRISAVYENGPVISLSVAPSQRQLIKGKVPRGVYRFGDLKIPGRALSVDVATVLHALTYYWARREARPELGSDAALHRIRAGSLGPYNAHRGSVFHA